MQKYLRVAVHTVRPQRPSVTPYLVEAAAVRTLASFLRGMPSLVSAIVVVVVDVALLCSGRRRLDIYALCPLSILYYVAQNVPHSLLCTDSHSANPAHPPSRTIQVVYAPIVLVQGFPKP